MPLLIWSALVIVPSSPNIKMQKTGAEVAIYARVKLPASDLGVRWSVKTGSITSRKEGTTGSGTAQERRQ